MHCQYLHGNSLSHCCDHSLETITSILLAYISIIQFQIGPEDVADDIDIL
jgi:hypothetical protein